MSDFHRYLCQTGPTPIGFEVDRAAGSTIWDAQGNAYLDLLAGIGVAHIGHTPAEGGRAGQRQAERYLHGVG